MIIVLGLGQMGSCATLALSKLGNLVTAIDSDKNKVDLYQEKFDKSWELGEHPKINCFLKDETNFGFCKKTGIDCVLSCLPYHQNIEVAKFCIENHIPYCDLGGDPPVEAEIKALAQKAEAPVFLSLGLAPGLVNIITEHLISKHGVPDEVYMYVGGLPQHLFRGTYQRTWSIEGLYNEYAKDCQILKGGQIEIVAGMDSYENLDSTYESFLTSGGISHSLESFKNRGVKNAEYRTIRYKGHHSQILPLISNLSKEECLNVFEKIFPQTKEDFVKMRIELFYWDSGTVKVEYNHVWYSDPEFTALARTTAYPAAAIVHMVAQGNFNHIEQKILDYSMIEFSSFSTNLTRLGLLP